MLLMSLMKHFTRTWKCHTSRCHKTKNIKHHNKLKSYSNTLLNPPFEPQNARKLKRKRPSQWKTNRFLSQHIILENSLVILIASKRDKTLLWNFQKCKIFGFYVVLEFLYRSKYICNEHAYNKITFITYGHVKNVK